MSDRISDLEEKDRLIINSLQGGFPVAERPFELVADELEMSEDELIARIDNMLASRVLSRFGPMYNADKMGGAFCLCAMEVPTERFDKVARQVNAYEEVAHNYEREHQLNMWFVMATEHPDQIAELAIKIEDKTGLKVHLMPKLEEFFIGLKVNV